MLVVMNQNATQEQIDKVISSIEELGCVARPIPGGDRTAIGVLHNKGSLDPSRFLVMPGVKDAVPITRPYKLVGRESQPHDSVIRVGNTAVGGDNFAMIAGPCAVESEEQVMAIAEAVKKAGATMFRGGAFKPRTSPYSFQGLGEKGLKIMAKARDAFDLPIVTEVMDVLNFDLVEEMADVVQIGTRNMQNFSLLKRAGKSAKPVLLKRGMAATIDEWLMAAEYIMEAGNSGVILCERGVRTFVHHSRNTLDLSAVLVVKKESHLPVVVDPSHAAGRREQVVPLGRAAAVSNANGLMVEVHHQPEKAMSDGAQSLLPDQYEKLVREVTLLRKMLQESE